MARSRHPGGVNACLGDASVRFFADGIDPTMWFYMGGAADGRNIIFD
jgi:prepilin-type processing-associated H-X9-DG protein